MDAVRSIINPLLVDNGYERENLRYVSSLLHDYLASMRYLQQFRHANILFLSLRQFISPVFFW